MWFITISKPIHFKHSKRNQHKNGKNNENVFNTPTKKGRRKINSRPLKKVLKMLNGRSSKKIKNRLIILQGVIPEDKHLIL